MKEIHIERICFGKVLVEQSATSPLILGVSSRVWRVIFFFSFFLGSLCGMLNLCTPTRDRTHASCIGSVESFNHWTAREVPGG